MSGLFAHGRRLRYSGLDSRLQAARFMSAPARLTGAPPRRLFLDSLAEAAPTLRDCHARCFPARPVPVRVPSLSFPFLGAWILYVRAETTNASKEGKETT